MVTLEEGKSYLRVDSDFDDAVISALLASSEALCMDVARLSAEEWAAIRDHDAADGTAITIRGEEKSGAEATRMKEVLRVGVLYALGYQYEHREEADHHDLVMTLRSLLFSIREGVV